MGQVSPFAAVHSGLPGRNMALRLDARIDLAFKITWVKEKDDGGPTPKVSRQEFRPDMADTILIIDFHKGYY